MNYMARANREDMAFEREARELARRLRELSAHPRAAAIVGPAFDAEYNPDPDRRPLYEFLDGAADGLEERAAHVVAVWD